MPATQYVTPQDLLDEFGERELIALTDIGEVRTGAVDAAVSQRACDRVNAEIAAAVSARYTLPLASTPEVLRYIGQDLAHFYLYQSEPPTWVQTRFDAARKTLRDIQTGVLPLGIDTTGASVTTAAHDLPQIDQGGKVFARGAW